jgi:hypothetical protein
MATYNSSAVANKIPAAAHGLTGNVKVARAQVTCTASPATTDTINFFDLPANARIHYALLQASDMDTNGTPLLALNIGYSGSAVGAVLGFRPSDRPEPWRRKRRSRLRICS